MKVRKFNPVNKSQSGHKEDGGGESVMGLVGSFIMAVFRRKKRNNREKDGQKFSRDEQLLAGIMASEDLLDQVSDPSASEGNT
mgnify:CR=1 FL=1